ncbi:hypothetical protein HY641_00700, partial [Candidatus Woesearchaeota archaeon]|nr:hypothetical protein [Candidatus Woesearchaeota archaeon]
KEKKAKKEGKTIEYTPKQLAHIDKDGTFAVKGKEIHYGYKDQRNHSISKIRTVGERPFSVFKYDSKHSPTTCTNSSRSRKKP